MSPVLIVLNQGREVVNKCGLNEINDAFGLCNERSISGRWWCCPEAGLLGLGVAFQPLHQGDKPPIFYFTF